MPIDLETCFEKVTRLEGRMDEHDKLYKSIHRRFDSIDNRFAIIDDRLNHLDAKIDSVRVGIDSKIDGLDTKIDSLRSDVDAKIDSLRNFNSRFFTWIIGLIIVSWLSTILLK